MWKLLERLQVASQKELVLLSCVYNFVGDHPLEMNHHDRSGDTGSARKMVYSMSLPKRESSSNSVGGSATLTTSGSTSLNSNNLMLGDDYSSPVLIQSQTPVASSLGPQNPPQSLNIPVQATLLPQTLPTTVAQMKKKSGFQITSVTPAQTSVSTNNSITEDTESCDDLDESHTEDLSSSEIMDVPLSRANNAGGPERSSSEETLNNFHEAETPGAMSPNQPSILTQAHLHGSMVNGTVHHHHHNPASSGKAHPAGGMQIGISLGAVVTSAVTSSSASTGQQMPSNVVGLIESASVGTTAVKPLATVASGTGMISVTSGATVSTGKPITNNVSMLNSASVPVVGGKSTNSNSVNYSPALNSISNQIVNLTHIPSGIIGMGITAANMVSGGVASTGGGQVGTAVMGQHTMPAPSVPLMNAQPQQAQVPTPASTSSRFRVVKLDSTSEPFKKGRWTCTEYYDKEAPSTSSSENAPSTRTVESIRQFVPESVACPDRESVSSTASHYTKSLSSGDTGGPCLTFQQPAAQKHDYSSTHNVSQMQPQDLVHAHLKTNAVAPSIQPPAPMGGMQTTIGHSTAAVPAHMPKLTYAQAAQSSSAQALPVVTQQQMGYPPAQQPAAPAQVAPAHINPLSQGGSLPPDFPQPKQIMNTVPSGSTQTLPHLSAPIPPVAGNGQLIAASQQPVGTVPPPAAQPLPQGLLQPQQTPAPQMVQLVQPAGAGLIQQTQGQQLAPQPSLEQQQAQLSSQGRSTQFFPALISSNVPPNLQSESSLIQNGSKEPGSQVSTLHSVMPTLQEDAHFLLQHPALLTQVGTSRGPEGSGGVNALTASASLLRSLPVDGEEDG